MSDVILTSEYRKIREWFQRLQSFLRNYESLYRWFLDCHGLSGSSNMTLKHSTVFQIVYIAKVQIFFKGQFQCHEILEQENPSLST